jgi:hypothetical protein
MACRGVLFALTNEQERALLGAHNDDDLKECIEEIEESWDEETLQETDKKWDAIHRCLSDGSLNLEAGTYPLNRCILGGRHLYKGDDYIIAFVSAAEVRDLARVLPEVTQDEFRERYDSLTTTDYEGFVSSDDFEYTWWYFEEIRDFYQRAAEAKRSVVFTVDQ